MLFLYNVFIFYNAPTLLVLHFIVLFRFSVYFYLDSCNNYTVFPGIIFCIQVLDSNVGKRSVFTSFFSISFVCMFACNSVVNLSPSFAYLIDMKIAQASSSANNAVIEQPLPETKRSTGNQARITETQRKIVVTILKDASLKSPKVPIVALCQGQLLLLKF